MSDAQPEPPGRNFLRDRTFRSLRHPNYRRYFFGQLASFIGSWVQSTAIMWLAFDLTNDPRWPAFLLVAQIGPTTFLGPLGGLVADRFPKRTIILITQFLFMLNAIVLTLLLLFEMYAPWSLLLLQVASGLVQAFDLPTRLAIVSELVPREDVINAVGLNSLLFNSARAIGPGIAGLIYLVVKWALEGRPNSNPTWLGSLVCFSLNSVSFAAVLAALWRIEPRELSHRESRRGGFGGGLAYLRAESSLMWLHVITGFFCLFAWPILTLLPAYTRLVLGRAEESYSLLLSSFGAGALVGAMATATFGAISRRTPFLLTGTFCGMTGLALFANTAQLPVAMGCCALMGFGMVLYLSTGQSTLQTCVPPELRGRVLALWAIMLSVSSIPGHLGGGILARHFPLQYVLLGMCLGVVMVFVGLVWLLTQRRFPNPSTS